jgi:hypothetical protein
MSIQVPNARKKQKYGSYKYRIHLITTKQKNKTNQIHDIKKC